MSSHEEYLDSLLKDLNSNNENNDAAEGRGGDWTAAETMSDEGGTKAAAQFDMSDFEELLQVAGEIHEELPKAPGTEDLQRFSEEDIEKILSESSKQEVSEENPEDDSAQTADDILAFSDAAEDTDLQEIFDLLQKTDNDEPVEEDSSDLLLGKPEADTMAETDTIPAADIITEVDTLPEEENVSEKETRKQARQAQKEAKKAERKAQKEAKKAKKLEKKKKADTSDEEGLFAESQETSPAVDETDLQDFSELDSLLGIESDGDMSKTQEEPEPVETANEGSLLADLQGLEGFGLGASDSAGMPFADPFDSVTVDGDDMEELMNIPEFDETERKKLREPKKGFLGKLLDFLMEDDEESEENENIKLSDENQDIIKEIDKEKSGKKGKKSAKKKGAADKKDGDEESAKGKKVKKEKKEKKKQKKQKPEQPEVSKEKEPHDTGKKLSLKKVLPVALVCVSLGAAVLILSDIFVNYAGRNQGIQAYNDEDYQTCYQSFFGMDLSESEEAMFHKAESIVKINLWLSEYELYVTEGSETEALDSLLRSVQNYPSLYEFASQWNAAGEVSEGYAQILEILSEKYHLSEAQAMEIYALPDDVEYTRTVMDIAGGAGYDGQMNQNSPQEEEAEDEEETNPDSLPEEDELSGEEFLDNNMQ